MFSLNNPTPNMSSSLNGGGGSSFPAPAPSPSPSPSPYCGRGSGSSAGREKILVSVRVRPLSSREVGHHDRSVWECADDRTIVHRPPPLLPDRSPAHQHNHPKSYTFDHVFGPDSVTLQVYEKGAKDVALSALSGINATIFAYGQTSSGKTFTMRGITENAVHDMYDYIDKHSERDFILRISAIEIYNEVVRDLLNSDGGNAPLRLLDDPEKGTKIERLVEDVVRDSKHLRNILSIIEAQRQVGETMLNETSSRSHQIIRLTVESFPCGVGDGGLVKSLVATLNLVDLAGSERASQTQSEGTRLKEGCHINRSLLTLTTIIRKLSGQGRAKSGHLPYRDSKLTRILQNSLGGNARTAIICTMSPAQAHTEQSRNTLFFATQAKEVTNTAQVNMVVSDKDMVKMLQKEVARLEAERRIPDNAAIEYSTIQALLVAKEAEIQQLRAEVKELHYQRDLAQNELDKFRKRFAEEERAADKDMHEDRSPMMISPDTTPNGARSSNDMVLCRGSFTEFDQTTPKQRSPCETRQSAVRQSPTASMMLIQEIKKLEQLQDELGEDANRALQALQKEVECLRLAQADMNQDAAATIEKLQEEIQTLKRTKESEVNDEPVLRGSLGCSMRGEISRIQAMGNNVNICVADVTIATLEEKLQNVQKSIDNMVLSSSNVIDEKPMFDSINSDYGRKSSPRSICRVLEFDNDENQAPNGSENVQTPMSCNNRSISRKQGREMMGDISSKEINTPVNHHRRNNSVDIKKMQNMFKTAAEENIRSIRTYVMELKERVAKLQYQKQLLVCQVLELESNNNNNNGGCVEDEDEQGCEEEEDEEEATMVTLDEAQSIITPPQESTASPTVYSVMPSDPENWKLLFQKERMQIAQLWDLCQVSIIHRSQFYLMFRGDPADQVYMEVELRRLAWLQEQFDAENAANLDSEGGDDERETGLAASHRLVRREREQVAKRMRTSLREEEREEMYERWGVYTGGKQRKMQVAYRVWTNPHDEAHLQASAEVVARVMGFWNPNKEASKEMFELTFAPPSNKKPWLQAGWETIISNLNALNI